MLPLMLQGRSARVAQRRRLESSSSMASSFPDSNGRTLAIEDSRPATRRRRYRSRNCRNFRLYGPFFQFADPQADQQSGLVSRGRSFMGGRATRTQDLRIQAELEAIQAQVERLFQQRRLLESRTINARTHALSHALAITEKFYGFFEHGFDPVKRVVHSRNAEAFLRAAMVDDVVCTEFTGVDNFIRQYEVGTRNHAKLTLELKRVSLVDNGDHSIQVRAEATAHFRISRVTLEQFFPSIIQDEDLTQRLIGKEYQMQYDKVFHFADGRIFQHESRTDMCSGLLEMVGDPFLAVRLFQASIMTKHGHWKINEDVGEDRHMLENSTLS